MSTTYFNVDHFQLNAGLDHKGDAAIALLVLKNSAVKSPIGEVKSAVLIDGGDGPRTAGLIVKAIKYIESKYKGYTKTKPFKFDAVVISHWDTDHYRGFLHFLKDKTLWTGDQFRHFKYDTSTPPKPLTRLYCQIEYPKSPKRSKWGFGYQNSALLKRSANIGNNITWDVKVANVIHEDVLTGAAGVDNVIGVNVFNGSPSDIIWSHPSIDNPLTLCIDNNPWQGPAVSSGDREDWPGAPGFYIVGAEGQYIGNTSQVKSTSVGVIDNENDTDTNPNSLILLLVWEHPQETSAKISFYSGGDAEFLAEDKTANFVKPDTIQVVKAGHHGSAAGTSTYFIETVKPQYYVISNGKEHGHPVPEVLLYLDSYFTANAIPLATSIYSTCYPYHLGYVEDINVSSQRRYYKNHLTNPDLLTTLVSSMVLKPDEKLYPQFITNLQASYSAQGISDDPITKFTPLVVDIIKNLGAPVKAAEAKVDKVNSKPNRKALAKAKANLAEPKAQALSPIIENMWSKWSPVKYKHFPPTAFTPKGSVPSDLVIIDWISIIFSYDSVKDQTSAALPKIVERDPKPALGSTAKFVKLDDDKFLLESSSGPGDQLSSVKRKTEPRVGIDDYSFSMTEEQETMVQWHELDGEGPVFNPAYDPDIRGGFIYELPTVSQALSGNSAAKAIESSVAPTRIYPDDGPTGNTYLNMDDASNSDYFVAGLQGGCLLLSTQLGNDNSSWSGSASQDDNLLKWVAAFFAAPASLTTMQWKGILASPYNLEGALTVSLPGCSTVQYSSDLATLIGSFDITTSNQTLMTLIDAHGFFNPYTGLVYGLQASSAGTMSMTIAQVLQTLEMSSYPILDTSIAVKFHTDTDTSNGFWINPAQNNALTWRMTLKGDTDKAYFLLKLPGFSFQNSIIVATKSAHLNLSSNGGQKAETYMVSTGSISIQTQASLSGVSGSAWSTYIDLSDSEASFSLRWNDTGSSPVGDLFTWLASSSGPNIQAASAFDSFESILDQLEFRLRELKIRAENTGSGWVFSTFSVVFELDITWGAADDSRVPVKLSFSYISGSVPFVEFSGGLWSSADNVDITRLIPGSPPYPMLNPNSTHKIQPYISLLDMQGIDKSVKDSFPTNIIPTYITGLNLTINTDGISFSGEMQSSVGTPPSSWLNFDSISINAGYSSSLDALTFDFSAEVSLPPRGDPDSAPSLDLAILSVDIIYDGGWSFEGSVYDLNVGHLYSLFPGEDNEAAMNVMQEITLSCLDVTYAAAAGDVSFEAVGNLEIGDIELDFDFVRGSQAKGGTGWQFSASLSAGFESTGTSLGGLLAGVSSDVVSALPSFVTGLDFAIPSGASITLQCENFKAGSDSNGLMMLSIVAVVGDFSFSYVQMSGGASTLDDGLPNNTTPKRFLKFALSSLGSIDDVPLLDSITQPFDSMNFIYANDDFTRDEMSKISSVVAGGVVFKDPRTETSDSSIVSSTSPLLDIVFRAGCHFQVLANIGNKLSPVLDYVFGVQQPPPPTIEAKNSGQESLEVSQAPETIVGAPAQAPWCKTIGPLTISAIGIGCHGDVLEIVLDASIRLGPLAGIVKAFTLSLPLSKLPSLEGTTVSVKGIGLELDHPPVSIAGLLQHNADGSFQGGVAINITPYAFLAGGYYNDKVLKADNSGTFKSLFVFTQLEGPIAEFEFASINGLQGGVGYNSQIKLPTIDDITDFPFLASGVPQNGNILQVLDTYLSGKWITPADGPCWIAAGLTVKAFQTLLIKAVVVLDLSDDIRFGIFADVLANIPASAKNDTELFARIDMSLLAIIDPAKGTFQAEGQLTPKSFILDQNCHLRGGFALCYWFEGSGHEGDWVFTVGGFHSAYKPPAWYPRPPRVSISWQYDSSLSIYGDAYFAITPKCCMGGGVLKLSYKDGSLSAALNAYADFLINYHPFSFIASIGVDINIKYTAEFCFITKTFDVHFGANLELHGPPVAGVAHVDWYVVSFDIYFGNSTPSRVALTWTEFSALLRQETGTAVLNGTSDQGLHSIATSSGTMGDNNNPNTQIHSLGTETVLVNASDFAFRFTSLFPITSITYASGATFGPAPQTPPSTYMKPMQLDNSAKVSGDLTISIVDAAGSDGKFSYQIVQKQVPSALWTAYPSSGNVVSSLLDPSNATVLQNMAIDFIAPTPNDKLDWIQYSIIFGSTIQVATIPLPSSTAIPAAVLSTPTFTKSLNRWSPMTSWPPYSPRNVLGRVQRPRLAASDVINAWIDYSGTPTDTPVGQGLANLGASATTAPAWTNELYTTPTQPLPILTGEATMKALVDDGFDFAQADHSVGSPMALNREFLDGGYPWGK